MMPLISTAQFNELGVGNQFRIELRKEAYFVVPDDDQLVSVGLFSKPLVKGHELLCVPLLLMSPQCNSTSPAGRQLIVHVHVVCVTVCHSPPQPESYYRFPRIQKQGY